MVRPGPVWSHGGMSNDDDIERLLREVNSMTSPSAQPPAKRPDAEVAQQSSGGSAAMVLVISAVIGIVGWVLGFLPLVDGVWLGLGGFLGSFLALTVYRRLS